MDRFAIGVGVAVFVYPSAVLAQMGVLLGVQHVLGVLGIRVGVPDNLDILVLGLVLFIAAVLTHAAYRWVVRRSRSRAE